MRYAKTGLFLFFFALLVTTLYIFLNPPHAYISPKKILSFIPTTTPSFTPVPSIHLSKKILENDYHIFQTFNNCGPASLSMALSYYQIWVSQNELGERMRPYQNAEGDNDDKSVTLNELARTAEEYGLTAYHRPAGNMDLVKKFLGMNIPVITRTTLKKDDDIGHFRIIKGYDDTSSQIIQDDSYDGKNISYSYEYFETMWKKFGYEYLVLIPQGKKEEAEKILGEDIDVNTLWKKAAAIFRNQMSEDSSDAFSKFNLSVALYHLKMYEESVMYFEQAEQSLPFRTLWYQIEPIESYYELGQYNRVFQITDKILTGGNRAFSELYHLRGLVYLKQNNTPQAIEEFEKAVLYNRNFQPAKEILKSLEG